MGLRSRASLASTILAFTACGNAFTSSSATDAGAGADVSTADVASDASGPTDSPSGGDSSPPRDGGAGDGPASDGPALGDGGPVSSYCATHMGMFTFCEDFDSYKTLPQLYAQWPDFSTTGGSFTLDTANAFSPPNALTAATSSTTGVRTLIIRPMPLAGVSVTKQRLEFDFYIDAASGIGVASAAAVAAIVFGADVSAGAVALAFGNGPGSTSSLQAIYLGPQPDGGLPAFGSASAPPPFPSTGQWDGRFAIEIDYSPGAATPEGGTTGPTACAQLYIGSEKQLSPCLALPSSLSRVGPTSIALGVYSGGFADTGTVGVTFDNVTYLAQ